MMGFMDVRVMNCTGSSGHIEYDLLSLRGHLVMAQKLRAQNNFRPTTVSIENQRTLSNTIKPNKTGKYNKDT